MSVGYEYSGSSISREDWDYALDLVSDWQGYPKTEGLASDIGILARAFAHLKVCYDECVKINAATEAGSLLATCAGCEPWNLTCPKCGEAKGTGKCGWGTNCPVDHNPAYPSSSAAGHIAEEKK